MVLWCVFLFILISQAGFLVGLTSYVCVRYVVSEFIGFVTLCLLACSQSSFADVLD